MLLLRRCCAAVLCAAVVLLLLCCCCAALSGHRCGCAAVSLLSSFTAMLIDAFRCRYLLIDAKLFSVASRCFSLLPAPFPLLLAAFRLKKANPCVQAPLPMRRGIAAKQFHINANRCNSLQISSNRCKIVSRCFSLLLVASRCVHTAARGD